jgi:hypothetical protein
MPLPAGKYANNLAVMPAKHTAALVERKRAIAAERDREAQLKTKIDRVAGVLDRLEARQARAAEAVEAWKRREKFYAARQAAIEDRVLELMTEASAKEIAGCKRTLTAHVCGTPSLVVDDESLIPAEWMRTPKPAKAQPDKLGIKRALAEDPDLEIAGVHLAQTISLVRK